MGIEQKIFTLAELQGGTLLKCRHHLLTRVWQPAFSNSDQGAEDAAYGFSQSATEHLQSWFAQYELPRTCKGNHSIEMLAECSQESIVTATDEEYELLIDGPGLRDLKIWSACATNTKWMVLGIAKKESEFWDLVRDDEDVAGRAEPGASDPAKEYKVFFLTDEDGRRHLNYPDG